jgi:hypothetical protein
LFILLPDFAVVPHTRREMYDSRLIPVAPRAVMRFYDRLGWRRTAGGIFHDADINEDFREMSRDYIQKCHLRVRE